MTTEIFISEVEIILILILFLAKHLNIFPAMPACERIPTPTNDNVLVDNPTIYEPFNFKPFVDNPNKGAFILCRTSNSSASEIQDMSLESKELLYEQIAKLAVKWNKNDNVGLVVGATVPEEINRVRKIAHNLPLLIPGIGAQGGDLKKSMKYGNQNGVALINISRGISYAGDLSEKSIRKSALEYLDKMRDLS